MEDKKYQPTRRMTIFTEVIFWMIIIVTAAFYLTTGNDMYNDRFEQIKQQVQIEPTKKEE